MSVTSSSIPTELLTCSLTRATSRRRWENSFAGDAHANLWAVCCVGFDIGTKRRSFSLSSSLSLSISLSLSLIPHQMALVEPDYLTAAYMRHRCAMRGECSREDIAFDGDPKSTPSRGAKTMVTINSLGMWKERGVEIQYRCNLILKLTRNFTKLYSFKFLIYFFTNIKL